MRRGWRLAAAGLAWAGMAAVATAQDTIRLRSGNVLEGQILSESESAVRIKLRNYGVIEVPRREVEAVGKGERLAPGPEPTPLPTPTPAPTPLVKFASRLELGHEPRPELDEATLRAVRLGLELPMPLAPEEMAEAVRIATAGFLDALAAGDSAAAQALLTAPARAAGHDFGAIGLGPGVSYRIGPVRSDGRQAEARLRLLREGEEGARGAMLRLTMDAGAWKVFGLGMAFLPRMRPVGLTFEAPPAQLQQQLEAILRLGSLLAGATAAEAEAPPAELPKANPAVSGQVRTAIKALQDAAKAGDEQALRARVAAEAWEGYALVAGPESPFFLGAAFETAEVMSDGTAALAKAAFAAGESKGRFTPASLWLRLDKSEGEWKVYGMRTALAAGSPELEMDFRLAPEGLAGSLLAQLEIMEEPESELAPPTERELAAAQAAVTEAPPDLSAVTAKLLQREPLTAGERRAVEEIVTRGTPDPESLAEGERRIFDLVREGAEIVEAPASAGAASPEAALEAIAKILEADPAAMLEPEDLKLIRKVIDKQRGDAESLTELERRVLDLMPGQSGSAPR